MPWKFWSTPESIESETPSVMAIVETVIAVCLYWYYAMHFDSYLPLMISIAVAPLVLLRSDESVALGVKWFRAFETSLDDPPPVDAVVTKVAAFAFGISFITICVGLCFVFANPR